MSDKSLAGVLRILERGDAPETAEAPQADAQAQPGKRKGKGKRRPPLAHRGQTVARLAAVQALYQMEVAGAGVETVVREFEDHRFGRDPEGEQGAPLADADEGYFAEVVRGVVADQAEVDRAVVKRLAAGWRLERLDATVRAMLRAGTWELMKRPDVPSEVVLDEYVELAKSFFEEAEPSFVNAALDGVARDVRP